MRPVSLLSATPSAYPQNQLQSAMIDVFIPAKTTMTVQAAATAQAALIDQWDANGRAVVDKSRVINPDNATQNETANQQFDGYAKALAGVKSYRQARGSLITDIGQYCSYCELPLTSSLAVEHTLPKHWFPESQLAWSNFLLACPVCNSVKGANPNQAACNPPYSTSAAAATQLGQIYAWPNSYWQTYANGSQLPVTLQSSASPAQPPGTSTPKKQRPTPPPAGMTWLDMGFAIIIGTQYLETTVGNQLPGRPYMTPVTVEIRAYGSGTQATALNATIALVGLNKVKIDNASAASVSDLRVAYRSQTEARAQSMLLHLRAVVSNQALMSAVPGLAYSLLQLIIASAAASGFWTVWIYALHGVTVIDANGNSVSAQSMLQSAFAGTATTTWQVGV